jgi:hypothetical protein
MGKHILKSEVGAVAPLADILPGGDRFHGATVPNLDKVPDPERWNLCIRQLGIKEKIGSLYIPDSVKDAQSYTHGMGVVLKVGKCVYRGRKYEDLGLTPEDGPQVGDIICFRAHTAPTRLKVQDIEVMYIPDDAFYARATPDMVDSISFKL